MHHLDRTQLGCLHIPMMSCRYSQRFQNRTDSRDIRTPLTAPQLGARNQLLTSNTRVCVRVGFDIQCVGHKLVHKIKCVAFRLYGSLHCCQIVLQSWRKSFCLRAISCLYVLFIFVYTTMCWFTPSPDFWLAYEFGDFKLHVQNCERFNVLCEFEIHVHCK